MTDWIDTIVVIIVVLVGLFIFYRALKEPVDLLFDFIKKAFSGIANSIRNKGGDYYETISYR